GASGGGGTRRDGVGQEPARRDRVPRRRAGAKALRRGSAMRVTLWALPAMLAACASTPDKDPVQLRLNDLEARVTRMERIVANEVQVSQSLDEVQGNLRELRGRLEELEHNNDSLRKQQRDLSGDLERRLNTAGEGTAGAALAGAAGGTAAGAAAAADAAAAGSNAPSPTEQAVYGQAFDALKAGSYSTAITGFKDFLHTYPSSSLADNAQYWLGEAYYVSHEYDSAAGAFRTVLKKWPDSHK